VYKHFSDIITPTIILAGTWVWQLTKTTARSALGYWH